MKKKNGSRKKSPSRRSSAQVRPARRRGMWKGFIAFGLVNIPIYLESATQEKKIRFNLIDKHDHSPIGYKQINKLTGKEVSHASIVKGYQYEKGEYVLMNESDFKKANVKASNTVEIEDFVELAEIDPILFETPYYILPQKGGEKGYVLLRDVLERTGKAAVAKIVLHTVQHLVCIMPRGDYLILEILRFANEIIEIEEADFIDESIRKMHVSEREIAVAEKLVEGMTARWKPEKYHNTYHDDLMKQIEYKIKHGDTASIEKVERPVIGETTDNVIDLTALLKRSLESNKRKSVVRGS